MIHCKIIFPQDFLILRIKMSTWDYQVSPGFPCAIIFNEISMFCRFSPRAIFFYGFLRLSRFSLSNFIPWCYKVFRLSLSKFFRENSRFSMYSLSSFFHEIPMISHVFQFFPMISTVFLGFLLAIFSMRFPVFPGFLLETLIHDIIMQSWIFSDFFSWDYQVSCFSLINYFQWDYQVSWIFLDQLNFKFT